MNIKNIIFLLALTLPFNGHDAGAQSPSQEQQPSQQQRKPAAGSMSCFLVAPVAGTLGNWALTLGGIALCADFVRVSLRDVKPRNPPRRGDARD